MVKTGSEMRLEGEANVCDLALGFVLSHTWIFGI